MESLQKSQATRSLEAENRRQAQTLFGVVALFAMGHVFRVVLNVHEIYLTSSFETKLNPGCASYLPFWLHVSCRMNLNRLEYVFDLLRGGNYIFINIDIYSFNMFFYLIDIDDHPKNITGYISFRKFGNILHF